jgi:hypothetical protein
MKLRIDDENKAKYYCKEAEKIESQVKKISDEVRIVYRERNVILSLNKIYEDQINKEKNILENEINNILDKIRNSEQICNLYLKQIRN